MKRYQDQYTDLGSAIYITVVGEYDPDETFKHIRDVVSAFNHRFSRFLEDSELSGINRRAGQKVSVSPAMLKLFESAKQMAQATDGWFNPMVLPELQRAGYLGSWTNKTLKVPDFRDRAAADPSRIEIGEDWVRLPFGSAFDTGGIGKGYLLDELTKDVEVTKWAGFWLSLGGDIAAGGVDVTGEGWAVGIGKASDSTKTIGEIKQWSDKLYVATSGVTKRRGHNWHHLIDPRTGAPAKTKILTATVVADSATVADVYAKVVVIAGASEAKKLYESSKIGQYFLQLEDGEVITNEK